MKINQYNQMMSYLSDSFNPALTRSKVATLEQREGFATGGTYKDYVSRGEEYKDLTFEEWLQEDKPGYKPSEFGRVDKAIGGGVIEGEDLGTREGFAEAKFDDPSAGIKVGDDLGDGISQQRIKKDGSVVYKVYKGKVKYKELESRAIPSYEDAVAEREKYVPFKKGTKLSKKGIKNEELDFSIVGSAEAPINPEITDGFLATTGIADDKKILEMQIRNKDENFKEVIHQNACRPFGDNAGMILGEAAQFVAVTTLEFAITNGLKILGGFTDVAINADGIPVNIDAADMIVLGAEV